MAPFVTFGESAEDDGIFPGQETGQPMAHELQNELAVSTPGAPHGFSCPGGIMGKRNFGPLGESVRVCFRDASAKIVARLIHDLPGQIQRTITGLPFKFPDWLVNLFFHAGNFISSGATKAVQCSFQPAPSQKFIRLIAKTTNKSPTSPEKICPCHAIKLGAAGRGKSGVTPTASSRS